MMAAHPERLLQKLLALVPHEPSGRATDTELLRRFAPGGDEDAFAALIARHGPMVLGACRRLLRDAGAAEDVAQATFLVLARKARSVRQPEALAAWLHQTACHLALKHRRADTRRRDRETRVSQVSPRPMSDPVDELVNRELREAIDEEIQRMPERFRLPVVLCCLEGRSLEETGRRLDWTPGSVKGRLERGRAELRSRLVRRGFVLSAACAGLDVLREGARASLPAGFGAATLRAAVGFASRSGVATGLGNTVAAIAEEGVRGATLFTRKVVLSFLLVVGVLGGGVVAVGPPAQPKAATRARPAPPAQPVEKPQPRADRHGDPLPDGAVARLGTVRWRNVDEIDAIAFAPDGKTLATASQVGVNLFDASGKLTKRIRMADTSSFRSLAFSPDGTRLACLCKFTENRMLRPVGRIFELGAERKPKEIDGKDLLWVGWSAAGKPLALFQGKDDVVLREVDTGKVRRFEAKDMFDPRIELFRCAYAPAAKLLAFADSHAAIHICDVSTGKKRRTIETTARFVEKLSLSADGRLLAVSSVDAAGKGVLQIWDVVTGKKTESVADRYTMAFAPDGKTLVLVGSNEIRFRDPSTSRERVQPLTPPLDSPSISPNVAFTPDGKTLATTGLYTGTIQIWDVTTGKRKAAPEGHTDAPRRFDFSPDGKRVVSMGGRDGTVIVWNSATGEPLTVIRRGEWVRGAAFSADGKSLFSCWAGDQVVVYDASTGRQLHTLRMDDPARKDLRQSGLTMRLSADRKTLVAFSDGYKGKEGPENSELMTAWDAATRKQTFQRRIEDRYTVSPDLQFLALTRGGKNSPGRLPVRIEDCKTGEVRQNLPQFPGQTFARAFSPDGWLLTTITSELPKGPMGKRTDTLRVWEVATAGEVLSLPVWGVARVAFSPDGRLLATSVSSQEILLWDLRRAEELQRVKGFDGRLISLAFSPDGRRLVSGLADTTLLVWEVKKPAKVRRLDAEGITQAWADLAGDPRKAFAARGMLADSPAEAVALLKKRLGPVRPAEAGLLRGLFADLDSDSFAVREKARKGLEALDDRATDALREALRQKPPLEVRRRIEALLIRVNKRVLSGEALRPLRAVGVLEDIGTREAKAILETLAGGVPGARLTKEAKAALRRMGHTSATRP
jgi:RNA polymerase sigma factor (sigma-70 family)